MKIIIALFFILSTFSIAFSESSEVEDVKTVVKIWSEIQEYVDASEFHIGSGGINQHHTDYIAEKILTKYGIVDWKDFVIGVLGTLEYEPLFVLVSFKLNGEEYSRTFEIKNVKVKDIEDGCDDSSRCA